MDGRGEADAERERDHQLDRPADVGDQHDVVSQSGIAASSQAQRPAIARSAERLLVVSPPRIRHRRDRGAAAPRARRAGRAIAASSASTRISWRRSRTSVASDRFSTSSATRVDRARQAAQQPGDVAIARVDVRRDLLQEHRRAGSRNRDQLGDRVAQDRQRAVDRRPRLARDRHVPVDVIDHRRVERLLLLEQRRDGAAHAGDESPRQTAGRPAARRSSRAC